MKVNFGGIGRRGTEVSYTFSCKEEAYQKIKPILKKKASAQNRLGCSYNLVEYYRHPSLKEMEILPLLTNVSSTENRVSTVPLTQKSKDPKLLSLFESNIN